jgi:hypothetical protein
MDHNWFMGDPVTYSGPTHLNVWTSVRNAGTMIVFFFPAWYLASQETWSEEKWTLKRQNQGIMSKKLDLLRCCGDMQAHKAINHLFSNIYMTVCCVILWFICAFPCDSHQLLFASHFSKIQIWVCCSSGYLDRHSTTLVMAPAFSCFTYFSDRY